MKKILLTCAATAALFVGQAACADQIIQNGNFADSSFANWTSTFAFSTLSNTADGSGSAITGATYSPGEGASLTPPIDCCAHLIQTVSDTAGTAYTLTLSTMEDAGPNSAIAIYWNGVLEDVWTNAANSSYPNWVQLTGMGNYVGTGSDTFELVAYQNPAAIWIDDISLSSGSTNNVPEPGSLLLVGAALAGAAAARRRKAH